MSPGLAPSERSQPLFQSFILGGFECSTQRRSDGRRLDLIVATGHDRAVKQDFEQLIGLGISTVRDGLRWHLIETQPGRYDWSSLRPALQAAHSCGMQVVWDLCHYGWPDDLDPWGAEYVSRFARFASAAATVLRQETDGPLLICPVNEISYLAWAGGEVARLNPLARGRGGEFKTQLVRAAIAAIEAVWEVDRDARIIHTDPVINVMADAARPQDRPAAEGYRLAQFEGWDMLSGRLAPELGGRPEYLDVVGVNYYFDNQWLYGGPAIGMGHPFYTPLADILAETYQRYGRPVLIAETGAEGRNRPGWFRYVAGEVRDAQARGVPVEGICIYPVVQYPGWEDERECQTGLLGPLDANLQRAVYRPLAEEVAREQALFRREPGAAQNGPALS